MLDKRDLEELKEFAIFYTHFALCSLAMAVFFGTLVQFIFP